MTVLDTALHASLRTLKLSGMLHTLDARLAQAHAGELGPPRVPAGPLPRRDHPPGDHVHAPAACAAPASTQQTTLEGFDFAASPKLPAAQIRDLAALRWLHSRRVDPLHGPVGVGKTHVAQALGHLAIRHGAEVRFTKTSRALADLAGGHADRTWTRRLAELARPAVLILDDFAMRELTAHQADDLYELITERAQAGRSLIITSNRSPGRLVSAVPQPRRRRVPARPTHQHQPPGLHERTQLPTQQATRPRRPPVHDDHQVASTTGQTGGIT